MDTLPRTLLLMRHAKADSPDGVEDHERPLAARGRRAAPAVGLWLAEQGLVPDHALCSDAARARETAELVLGEVGSDVRAEYLPELYEAGVHQVLELVSRTGDGVRTLLLVGHEPVTSETVKALTGRDVSLPTAAVAVIEVPGQWDDVADGTGTLREVRTPKG
jgi:phosphohistidine phosphatase